MKIIQKIPISHIDLTDETFSVNFMPDLRCLRSSMEAVGLIQPVLLRKRLNRYQIICGFRRISVWKELGGLEIESRMFEEKEMDEFRLFSLSLHENVTTRGFNTVEKAIALDKGVHRFQIHPTIAIKTFLPLLSLEPNEKILATYLSLAQMEDEIKTYVLKEEVSRSNIRRLASSTPGDRMAILSLVSPLKLGENRLREILTLLEEISRRNQWTVREIVDRSEILAILSKQEFTPSQKAEHIKKVLMTLRYPKMYQLEEKFEEKKKGFNLPSSVSLYHQPFFEGRGLKVAIQFETIDEYRAILKSLLNLTDKKEFEEMIRHY